MKYCFWNKWLILKTVVEKLIFYDETYTSSFLTSGSLNFRLHRPTQNKYNLGTQYLKKKSIHITFNQFVFIPIKSILQRQILKKIKQIWLTWPFDLLNTFFIYMKIQTYIFLIDCWNNILHMHHVQNMIGF